MLRKILAGGTIAAASTLLIGPPALAQVNVFYPCAGPGTGDFFPNNCGTLSVPGEPATGVNPISITASVNPGTTGGPFLESYRIVIDSLPSAGATDYRAISVASYNNTAPTSTSYLAGIAVGPAGLVTSVVGLDVNGTRTFLSGGSITPNGLMLDNSRATFGNVATGAPITVTGVADGVNPFDAVNFRQLQGVSSGVASIAAMSNIPGLDPNKKFGIGIGYGNFQGNSALAVGINGRLAPSLTAKLSVGAGLSYGATTVGTGLSYSW